MEDGSSVCDSCPPSVGSSDVVGRSDGLGDGLWDGSGADISNSDGDSVVNPEGAIVGDTVGNPEGALVGADVTCMSIAENKKNSKEL